MRRSRDGLTKNMLLKRYRRKHIMTKKLKRQALNRQRIFFAQENFE